MILSIWKFVYQYLAYHMPEQRQLNEDILWQKASLNLFSSEENKYGGKLFKVKLRDLQQRFFHVNWTKYLEKAILSSTCERLLQSVLRVKPDTFVLQPNFIWHQSNAKTFVHSGRKNWNGIVKVFFSVSVI